MEVIEPGHVYRLRWLDGEPNVREKQFGNLITFVKREGDGYPGNVGHHPGTTIQEVLRALIDRVKYLDSQVPHVRNEVVLASLRGAIFQLELRAAERHHRGLMLSKEILNIEEMPVCPKCLHIGCEGNCHP